MSERTLKGLPVKEGEGWVIMSREDGAWHPIPHTVSHFRKQAIAALEAGYDDDTYEAARKRGELMGRTLHRDADHRGAGPMTTRERRPDTEPVASTLCNCHRWPGPHAAGPDCPVKSVDLSRRPDTEASGLDA